MFLYVSIMVVILCSVLVSCQSAPVNTYESFIQNTEEFIPSHEWQIVKEGQAIPAGLHIRLNLQTGLREAKLLEDAPSNSLVAIDHRTNQTKPDSTAVAAVANLNPNQHDPSITPKSVKDFQAMNMNVRMGDGSVIDLLNQLKQTRDHQQIMNILTDLEYLLHEYDKAILFADRNGLESLQSLLKSTEIDDEICSLVMLTLGAAFQGNARVQSKGFDLGFVPSLLHLFTPKSDPTVQSRIVFALSTLLRNFSPAQQQFLSANGVETLLKIFDPSVTHSQRKVQLKILQLFIDLIEEKNEERDQTAAAYENVDISQRLIANDWCSQISTHFISLDETDWEHIEKTLMAMTPFTDACSSHIRNLLARLDHLNDVYTKTFVNDDSKQTDLSVALRKLLQIRFSIDL